MYVAKHKKGFALTQDDLDYYFGYLDQLRESGEINMAGAPREIQSLTEGPLDEAIWIVELWIKFLEDGELEAPSTEGTSND